MDNQAWPVSSAPGRELALADGRKLQVRRWGAAALEPVLTHPAGNKASLSSESDSLPPAGSAQPQLLPPSPIELWTKQWPTVWVDSSSGCTWQLSGIRQDLRWVHETWAKVESTLGQEHFPV